mgnify:CR=1 FL=1
MNEKDENKYFSHFIYPLWVAFKLLNVKASEFIITINP